MGGEVVSCQSAGDETNRVGLWLTVLSSEMRTELPDERSSATRKFRAWTDMQSSVQEHGSCADEQKTEFLLSGSIGSPSCSSRGHRQVELFDGQSRDCLCTIFPSIQCRSICCSRPLSPGDGGQKHARCIVDCSPVVPHDNAFLTDTTTPFSLLTLGTSLNIGAYRPTLIRLLFQVKGTR